MAKVYNFANLTGWLGAVEHKADQRLRALVLETFRRVVKRTPRDEGVAANNWNLQLNTPNLETTTEGNPGRQVVLTDIPVKIFPQVTYITNNLSYINALEHGSSKQAPNGMVSVTIQELQIGLIDR